jgi:hypothetical protein
MVQRSRLELADDDPLGKRGLSVALIALWDSSERGVFRRLAWHPGVAPRHYADDRFDVLGAGTNPVGLNADAVDGHHLGRHVDSEWTLDFVFAEHNGRTLSWNI